MPRLTLADHKSTLAAVIRVRNAVIGLVFVIGSCCAILRAEKISDIHPRGYVTDLADVVEPATEERIEALCTEVERKTGAQIAVVSVRSLEGKTRQEYGNELFKHLGVGGKSDDRGVLLLLAPPERQYWIEVGYGLEPVINDARAGDVGRAMVPLLRENQYSAAIENATRLLAQFIADDKGVTLDTNPNPVRTPEAPSTSLELPWWAPLLIFGGLIFILRLLSHAGRRRRRSPSFWWLGPGGFGGGGWGGGGFGGSSGGWGGGGGFGGFGGGSSGGGGAGGSW